MFLNSLAPLWSASLVVYGRRRHVVPSSLLLFGLSSHFVWLIWFLLTHAFSNLVLPPPFEVTWGPTTDRIARTTACRGFRMSRPTGSWSWSIHITYAAPPIYESAIELTRYFKSKRDSLERSGPRPL